ncbi:MAG: hypothetical protein D6776_10075 [Planctomycetota bacterium]|nr:MAG: hypothetical protein D6776_10075 [Planctomycetota bacterium]
MIAERQRLERDRAALPERETQAKQQAQQLAEQQGQPIALPDPFTEKDKTEAEERERELARRVSELTTELERARARPEALRAEIAEARKRLETLQIELGRLRGEEARGGDDEARRALRRRIALAELEIAALEQHIANLNDTIELLQGLLPVLRLERDNAERAHARAKQRLELYTRAWESRLAAERARLAEQQRVAEVLAREGLPYEKSRAEAEKLLLAEADRTKAIEQEVSRWEQRLLALRTEAEKRRAETKKLEEQLEKASGEVEARVALLLGRFLEAVRRTRRFYDTKLAPAHDEAVRRLAELRAALEALDEQRQARREQFDKLHEVAKALFDTLHARYPTVYPEARWEAEERRWRELETRLIESVQQRERALRTLLERLVDVIELASAEGQRLVELESIVRRRAFWLREKPIIEYERIAPAVAVLEGYVRRARAAVAEPGALLRAVARWIAAPGRWWRLLLALLAAGLLVLTARRLGVQLERRFASTPEPPVPWRERARRAALRVLEAAVGPGCVAGWTAIVHALFASPVTLAALWTALLVLGVRGLQTAVRVLLRPVEADWRVVPVADDVARWLARLAQRVLLVTAIYLGLFALAPLLGPEAAEALRPVLGLLYRYVLVVIGLLAAADPVVFRRLLRLFSRDMAERLQRAMLPLGLFVGANVLAIFGLEAVGYRNAARSVRGSLLTSLGVIVAGLVLDRVLFRMVVARLAPSGVEGGEADGEGAEDDEQRRRRAFLLQLLGGLTDAVVLVAVLAGILFAYEVEPTTIERVLATPIVPPAEDGTGGVVVGGALAAALILLLTWVIYRYVRGFFDLFVLPRLGLSAGARFAITSVAGYVIAATGVLLALGQLGIRLGELEWLLAAAGVGIGFGLQEILSNFVSGLILLIERPIEVGDVVTVGEQTGRVERITIRATTVQTPDNVSVIVPNKEFITSRVTNWSHGDPKVRLRIPVGVAYGSEVGRVRETLLEVARKHGQVMRRPPPEVHFVGFGASSLDFELFVWVISPRPGVRRKVISDLCAAIDAAFRRAGIEIPFPQLDLHVRDATRLAVRLEDGEAKPQEGTAAAAPEAEEPERAVSTVREELARRLAARRSRAEMQVPKLDGES